MSITIVTTGLHGVLIVETERFEDERGCFEESWNRRTFREAGLDVDFVQDNRSLSLRAGTLRGLHFQAPPHSQDKLIRCAAGAIFDVAVDIRCGSPTFGQWIAVELTPGSKKQLFIPQGFLHGFLTLTDNTVVEYKCSDFYEPDCDGSIRWDSLGIDWPLRSPPILSAKDRAAIDFAHFESPFIFGEEL